jgi:hypothetical protein
MGNALATGFWFVVGRLVIHRFCPASITVICEAATI